MGKILLIDLLKQIEQFEPDDVVYVPAQREVDIGAEVTVIAYEKTKEGTPRELSYFLEVGVIREVLSGLPEQLGTEPTPAQKLRAIQYYAKHDAYIETEELLRVAN